MSALKPPPEAAGWDVILPRTRDKKGNVIYPVTLSARGAGKFAAALTITINPAAFPEEGLPPWLKIGAKIWVMRGRGEFLGTLRLLPNGPTPVSRSPRGSSSLRITVKPQDGHPEQGAPRTKVDYDYSDSWFDITLPAWHGPLRLKSAAERERAPVVPATPQQQGKKPYTLDKPFTLAAGASSHPAWSSPKAQQEHARAVKGGAA